MNKTKVTHYLPSIDLLRGIAAISVTLFHLVIISRLESPSLFRDVFSFGHLGVQVFFVISGFVIPYSMYKGNYTLHKMKTFFKKRLVRLEPPYIASIILVFVFNYIFYLSPYWHEEIIDVTWSQLLFHLGYLNSIFQEGWVNQVYWSLGIEFQYYILMAFTFYFINHKTFIWTITFVFLLSLSILIPFESYIFNHLPFFIIGVLIFRFLTQKDSLYVFLVFITVTLAVIIYKYGYAIEFLLAAVFPFLFFFVFKKTTKIGRFLGDISYSLYLIHIPIGQRIIRIGSDFTHNVYTETLLILFTLGVTIFCSYVFFRIIEKPTKKLTKRFKYN